MMELRRPSKEGEGELLFFINLEIHDGKNEKLEFHANDIPEELAFSFCRRRGLSLKIYNLIVSSLNDKLKELSGRVKLGNSPARSQSWKDLTATHAYAVAGGPYQASNSNLHQVKDQGNAPGENSHYSSHLSRSGFEGKPKDGVVADHSFNQYGTTTEKKEFGSREPIRKSEGNVNLISGAEANYPSQQGDITLSAQNNFGNFHEGSVKDKNRYAAPSGNRHLGGGGSTASLTHQSIRNLDRHGSEHHLSNQNFAIDKQPSVLASQEMRFGGLDHQAPSTHMSGNFNRPGTDVYNSAYHRREPGSTQDIHRSAERNQEPNVWKSHHSSVHLMGEPRATKTLDPNMYEAVVGNNTYDQNDIENSRLNITYQDQPYGRQSQEHSRSVSGPKGERMGVDTKQLFMRPTLGFKRFEDTHVPDRSLSHSKSTKPQRSKSTMDLASKSAGKNASKRLYNMGLVNYYKRQNQADYAQQVKRELEMVEAKFAPEINKISHAINHNKGDEAPIYERLTNFGKNVHAKREKIREMKKEVEDNKFDYKPRVNVISKIINEERDRMLQVAGVPRYELLYDDGLTKARSVTPLKEKKTNVANQCTFKPQINEISKKIASKESKDFLKRMEGSIEKKQNQLKEHHFDLPETQTKSKKSLTPNITRPSRSKTPVNNKTPQQTGNKTIHPQQQVKAVTHSTLFKNHVAHQTKLEEMINEELEKIKRDARASKMTDHSKELINNTVSKKIMNIFNVLDQEKKGTVSKNDVDENRRKFSDQVLRIFNPFFDQISKKENAIDSAEFEASFRKFMKVGW